MPDFLFDTSETLRDFDTIEGRRLLHEFYHERRMKNMFTSKTLLECWKLCRVGTELALSDGRRVRFETSLGLKEGTRVFLEEIAGVYYYNFVQGLVYFGAMLVLVGVALHLSGYDLWYALAGLAIEAVFLLMFSVLTAYSRSEEPTTSAAAFGLSETLISSINSSIREMTNSVSDLFRLISQTDIRQDVLLTRLTENIAKLNAENARKFADKLDQTNGILREQIEVSRTQMQSLMKQQEQTLQQTRRMLSLIDRKAGEDA